MMPMRRLFIVAALSVLTGCTSPHDSPVISFIGVATGNLVTDLADLRFSSTFERDERNLVGVVGFEYVKEGTTVQATWFSPDDRQMPLGRTSIVTQSGAKIARFSFGSRDAWTAAPYMLQIDAFTGEGEQKQSATGSVSFFIGMSDADITAYRNDYLAWKTAEAQNLQEWQEEQERFQQMLGIVRRKEGFEHSTVLLRTDLTGDKTEDYVIADMEEQGLPPGGSPGVLLSAAVGRFAIVDHSGATLFSVRDEGRKRLAASIGETLADSIPLREDIQLTILPSFGISLYWADEQGRVCFAEFEPVPGGYRLTREGCREN